MPPAYPMPNFNLRSTKLERIDTGDYTPAEYQRFLREIAFINKYLGDRRALRRSLFRAIDRHLQKPARSKGIDHHGPELSVLDVGCGSGEMLKFTAEFARRTGRRARLVGLDLNEMSTSMTASVSKGFPEISTVRGDAFTLPFADGAFDYAFSSLFFHHLTDEQIPLAFAELSRVSRRGVFVIDLHRHPMAYALYKLFCFAFRISPLVTQDGSLSILKGFKPDEQTFFSEVEHISVERTFPFRLNFSLTDKL